LASKETRAEIKASSSAPCARQEYDYVFDTQGLLKTGIIMGAARGKGAARSAWPTAAKARATKASRASSIPRAFRLDPRTHAVARGRLVVAAARWATPVDTPADFGLPDVSPSEPRPDWMPAEPYAVYFHGTARDAKKWAPANWIELGRALAPMAILLPWGSPKEKAEAEFTLAAALPNARVLPKLSMADAVLLARHAGAGVGVDTGLDAYRGRLRRGPWSKSTATRRAGKPKATGRRRLSIWATQVRRRR
jgi:heptosyltransferase-1